MAEKRALTIDELEHFLQWVENTSAWSDERDPLAEEVAKRLVTFYKEVYEALEGR